MKYQARDHSHKNSAVSLLKIDYKLTKNDAFSEWRIRNDQNQLQNLVFDLFLF